MKELYSTYQLGGLGECSPRFFLKYRCSEIDSEAFWGYYLSVLKGKSTQADSVIFGL